MRASGVASRPPTAGEAVRPGWWMYVTGLVPKFMLLIGLLFVTFAVAQTYLSILAQERTIEAQVRQRAEATALTLARAARDAATRDEAENARLAGLIEDVARQDDLFEIAVLDRGGSVIVDSTGAPPHEPELADDPLSRRARRGGELVMEVVGDRLEVAAPVHFVTGHTGAVRLALSLSGAAGEVADMRGRNVMLVVWFIMLGVILALLLVRRLTRPLAELIRTTEEVSRGRLDGRISVRSRDELELLAESFNRMLDRLDATTVSRDYVTHILQSMTEGLAVLGVDGRIRLTNPAMSRLVGYREEELTGMLFERLLDAGASDVEAPDLIGRLQREGALDQVETYYLDREGRPVAVLVSGAVMWDQDHNPRGMICIAQDDRERRRQQEQVRRLAYFDSVTGLPNRVQFHLALDQALAGARRYGHKVAVLFLDLDDFKRINDTLGHATGDRLLLRFAERLTGSLRTSDTIARLSGYEGSTVARLGGDEFTILLGRIDAPDDAARVAARVLAALRNPFDLSGHEVVIDASIGIAICPDDADDPQTLLMHADTAMYHAKAQGRGHHQIYREDLNAKALERLTLEGDLRRALERGQLDFVFQPQLDLRTDRVVAAEALMRWHHPEKGPIPPSEFIPLAEETGLILPIGEWGLRLSCAQARAWLDQGLGEIRVAVNISSRQLWRPGFADMVERALADHDLPPRLLELEITESTAMADPEIIVRTLGVLKEMGVLVAVDDFGTGYSSLSYLKRFPLDRLKIDRSFIQDMVAADDDAEIVNAIIAVAHQLKLEATAEGVENEEQLALLCLQGCDEIQGCYLSAPMTAGAFASWLGQREAELGALTGGRGDPVLAPA